MAAVSLLPDSPPRISRTAIAAKWLGIAALSSPVFAFAGAMVAGGCQLSALILLPLPLIGAAVVLAFAARVRIARNPHLSGEKQARTGLTAGAGGLVLFLIFALAWPPCGDRVQGNEPSAVGSLRTINTAEVTYASTYPDAGFSSTLEALGGPIPCNASPKTACLIDSTLASGNKSGYTFTYTPGARDAKGIITRYAAVARPVEFGKTGKRSFFSDESGVIRATSENRAATAQDRPLQ